jgi:hypothetical protein
VTFPTVNNLVAFTSLSSVFRGKAEENMARRRGQRDGWLHEKNGTWLLTYRVYRWDAEKRKSVPARPTVSIGPTEGPGKLTRKQAERFAWDHFLSKIDNTALHPKSTMTLGEFWKAKYTAQASPKLKKATRIQYTNLWNNRIESAIGHVRLFELSPDDAESIVGNVMPSGRSTGNGKTRPKSPICCFLSRQTTSVRGRR